MISITGLDKSAVLAALYNASRPQGMGFMQYDPAPMTPEQAAAILAQTTYFDYLKGRVMKLNLTSDDEFNEALYDRDNGEGAAERVVAALRATADTAAPEIVLQHSLGVADAAQKAEKMMGQRSGWDWEENSKSGAKVFNLGLSDVAPELAPKVKAAVKSQTPQ